MIKSLILSTVIFLSGLTSAPTKPDTITADLSNSFVARSPQGAVLISPIPDSASCIQLPTHTFDAKVYDCGEINTKLYLITPIEGTEARN